MNQEKLKLDVIPLWDTRFPWNNNSLFEVVYNNGLKKQILFIGEVYDCNSFIKDCDKVNPLENLRSPWMKFGNN